MNTGIDPAWWRALQARVDSPPNRPRVALELVVGDAPPRVIGSVESSLALDLAGAGFPLQDSGRSWQLALPDTGEVDPTLAGIASWLRDQGRASAWRNELLEVVDAEGERRGSIERAAVRPLGMATHAVHLVVANRRGDAWIQQRALDKSVDPGLWDTTVGGLMSADENVLETLERETWEEAGLRLEQLDGLRPLGHAKVQRPLAEGYMIEHLVIYGAVTPDGTVPVNQDGEVARFECVSRAQLLARLHADQFTLEAALALARWLANPFA